MGWPPSQGLESKTGKIGGFSRRWPRTGTSRSGIPASALLLSQRNTKLLSCKIGVRSIHYRQGAEKPKLQTLHGVPVAVVKIGADEVVCTRGYTSLAPWAPSHPVVHGRGLVAVPMDPMRRRPLAVGKAMMEVSPRGSDGSRASRRIRKGCPHPSRRDL